MDEIEIKSMLDRLSDYNHQLNKIIQDKQSLIDFVLTEDIKARIAEIEAEFAPLVSGANMEIQVLTTIIKDAVIEYGATVKGQYRQAVYAKGRVSWDTKALDGYAAAHPEIAPFKKVGEPSVSIREV